MGFEVGPLCKLFSEVFYLLEVEKLPTKEPRLFVSEGETFL